MDRELERLVWKRSRFHCEYCFLPQAVSRARFHIEHVIAKQHGGSTVAGNLAIACPRCNLHKGTNLAAIDGRTKRKVWLFHPRRQRWSLHFRWVGVTIVGRTPVGRATSALLDMNNQGSLDSRQQLLQDGDFPPSLD